MNKTRLRIQKFYTVAIIISGISIFNSSKAQALCPSIENNQNIMELVNNLAAEAKVSSEWPQYQLAKFPVLIMDSTQSKKCLLVIRNGIVSSQIETANDINLPNKMFEFINPWKIENEEVFKEFKQVLKNQKISLGVLIEGNSPLVHYIFTDKSKLGQYSSIFHESESLITSYTLFHESVHVVIQSNTEKFPWPQGSNAMSRDSVTKCYNYDDTTIHLHYLEAKALMEAVALTLEKSERNNLISFITKFRDLRTQRRSHLKNIKQGDFDGKKCELSESFWEWTEGLPDFISLTTAMKIGLLAIKIPLHI